MNDFKDLLGDIRQARDEIHVRLHLASMEAREEWGKLEAKWDDFAARADVEATTEGVGAALHQLGGELKEGYLRLRDALRG
ncbi:MAG: hypothetical protein GTN86_13695 [Xanthomonadales bacterium]|nr:hypothetical protein [Xanthomonadales bacterium]NIN60764.1 hypothetical protein [Xanthomonadales bacterium]NIN76126.1 hypothetical protein [Xanthomonadales bacterium]NIO15347.1 hypothetical protein [Xanthomonadales bacterium]NIP13157.1 hypothetical protein [Xanthomonadales bacterium]